MKTKEKDNIVFIRLYPEENLNKKLLEACEIHNIKTAIVISGIGQIKNIILGYFKDKGNYLPEKFELPHELLSLNGNICSDKDGHLLHLHAVIGNEKKDVFGGHLIEGKVEVTCEIVLLKTDIKVGRKIDKKTGLKSLYLK